MTVARLRTVDEQRAARLLVAWLTDDKTGIDAALKDASDDPTGVSGLLFAVTTICAELASLLAPDNCVQGLQQALLTLARRDGDGDGKRRPVGG